VSRQYFESSAPSWLLRLYDNQPTNTMIGSVWWSVCNLPSAFATSTTHTRLGLITNPDFLDTFGHPGDGFLGIIGMTKSSLKTLSPFKELIRICIVSIYNIGCLLGCVLNFIYGARFGRRQAIWIAMAFIIIGAILQTSAFSVVQLMIGRVIVGLGVGIDTSTVPM